MPTWEDELQAQKLARDLKALEAEKKKELEGTRKCGNCGEDVKMGDFYCWNCAHALEGEWIKKCKMCKKLFKTKKPSERDTCNRCEGKMRKKGALKGIFRY